MKAIYKREMRSYFTSPNGYLFIFFVLILTGIYFSAYQLSALYPKFEYTLSSLTFVFLIGVPFLTMRTMAEERKQKTDQLLLTAPVSVSGIVVGKYLALVSVFAIPIGVMCLYPLIMTRYGEVSLVSAYNAILGFFLLGCANLAIGLFISALTENQVIAAVLTFVFLFSFFMMNGISSFFSQASLSTCVAFGVLVLLASIFLYTMIKNFVITIAAAILGELILVAAYFWNANIFASGMQTFLNAFNISGHLNSFMNSIFDIKGIIYFLSIIAICMFLTVQSVLKRRWN